jgi:hypothetical protein
MLAEHSGPASRSIVEITFKDTLLRALAQVPPVLTVLRCLAVTLPKTQFLI